MMCSEVRIRQRKGQIYDIPCMWNLKEKIQMNLKNRNGLRLKRMNLWLLGEGMVEGIVRELVCACTHCCI